MLGKSLDTFVYVPNTEPNTYTWWHIVMVSI